MRQAERPPDVPQKERSHAVTENQRDIDPELKVMRNRRRAIKAVCVFGAVFALGLLLRWFALGRSEGLRVLGNFITVAGVLGLAWWGSVLYDLGGRASGGGSKNSHP